MKHFLKICSLAHTEHSSSVITGSRRSVNEVSALPECYAA